MARTAADWTVYRVFFKGSPTPMDVETRSSWAVAKHRGIRLGSSFSDAFDNIGGVQNTMHLSGPKRLWPTGWRPENKEFSGTLADITTSESEMEANYWPVDSIAGIFHRNIYQGTGFTSGGSYPAPVTIDGTAYRIYFKNCPATMDVLAGGFVVTRQESFRMVIPGAETVVHRIERGGGFMVYFYGYGGQFYPDEYDWGSGVTRRMFNYELRYGLAGLMGSGGGYPALHPDDDNLGTTASLDSAATYLPLDNVRAIVRLNASDTNVGSTSANEVRIVQPTKSSAGLWTIFQPSAVGASLELTP